MLTTELSPTIHILYFNVSMNTSVWESLPGGSADPILGAMERCNADDSPYKLDLSVGILRNQDGSPLAFETVVNAQAEIHESLADHSYLPALGHSPFLRATESLVLGSESPAVADDRTCSVQTLGGAGALRLTAELLGRVLPKSTPVAFSLPTWEPAKPIFSAAGFTNHVTYPYVDPTTRLVHEGQLLQGLSALPIGAIVVLQPCAHNPSGADVSPAVWWRIASVIRERKLRCVVDCAYLGLASGDPHEDGEPIRILESTGLEFMVCVSFSKMFCLYGERLGAVVAVTSSRKAADALAQHAVVAVRSLWSSCPATMARIVSRILTDPKLKEAWHKELAAVVDRMNASRCDLASALEGRCAVPPLPLTSWDHLRHQRGAFASLGVGPEVTAAAAAKFHIYLTAESRVCVSALNSDSVSKLAGAIALLMSEGAVVPRRTTRRTGSRGSRASSGGAGRRVTSSGGATFDTLTNARDTVGGDSVTRGGSVTASAGTTLADRLGDSVLRGAGSAADGSCVTDSFSGAPPGIRLGSSTDAERGIDSLVGATPPAIPPSLPRSPSANASASSLARKIGSPAGCPSLSFSTPIRSALRTSRPRSPSRSLVRVTFASPDVGSPSASQPALEPLVSHISGPLEVLMSPTVEDAVPVPPLGGVSPNPPSVSGVSCSSHLPSPEGGRAPRDRVVPPPGGSEVVAGHAVQLPVPAPASPTSPVVDSRARGSRDRADGSGLRRRRASPPPPLTRRTQPGVEIATPAEGGGGAPGGVSWVRSLLRKEATAASDSDEGEGASEALARTGAQG